MSIFIHYFSVGNDFFHETYSSETIEENIVKVAYNKIIKYQSRKSITKK